MKKEKKAIDWGERFKAWTTKHVTAISSLTLVNALEKLQQEKKDWKHREEKFETQRGERKRFQAFHFEMG